MKKLFLSLALTLALTGPALAQNVTSGSPRVQGAPDGYGDPVQVTIVGPTGADVTSTTAPLVQGNVASAATDAGNPVKVGGKYNATNPTLTDGQRGDLQLTTNGRVKVEDFDTSGNWAFAGAASGIVSSTADVLIAAAPGAGLRNYVGSLQIAHDTLGAATEIYLKNGSTVIWRGKLQTTATEGTTMVFNPPIKMSVNTQTFVALGTSTTGGVYVNAQGRTARD